MGPSDLDKIKLLLNSEKAKEISRLLLQDFRGDFYLKIFDITITKWSTFPFIYVLKGFHHVVNIRVPYSKKGLNHDI